MAVMDYGAMEERLMKIFRQMMKVDFTVYLQEVSREEFFMLGVIDEYLTSHQKEEGISVSAIAKALDVSSPAVSRMLKGMEEKKYIKRKTSEQNRRSTLVRLTVSGNDVYRQSKKQLDIMFAKVMDRMGEEDMEELFRICSRLAEAFEEEAHIWRN